MGTICAAPLLLGVLLQLKLYLQTESSWETVGAEETALSFRHFVVNIPHAINFFFSYDDTLGNSLLLSVAGLVCCLVFFLLLRTEWKRYWDEKPELFVLAIFAFFLVGNLVVVMSFHAGQLDRPFVSRYALLFHLLLVLCILGVLEFTGLRWSRIWNWAILASCVFILGFTLPMNAKAIFSKRNFAVREQVWLEQISGDQISAGAAVIDRFTVPWCLRNWLAYDMESALQNGSALFNGVWNGYYSGLYFVERLHYTNGRFVADTVLAQAMEDRYELELVAERSFRPYALTRVYKILSFKAGSSQ